MKFLKLNQLMLLFSALIAITSYANENNESKGLKAILVVGIEEGDNESSIENMEEIAAFLISKKIKVIRFYESEADWNKIKNESNGAHFFIYSGHGSTLGENGASGGLCLTENINSKQIIEDLRLSKNAIVLFVSVCRGAGSSAEDEGDIGIKEAYKRVTDYARPFIQLGASCFYANNVESGVLNFLESFLNGKTVKESYLSTVSEWSKVEILKVCEFDSSKTVGVAGSEYNGIMTKTTYINGKEITEDVEMHKLYDNAFVGISNFTFKDLLK